MTIFKNRWFSMSKFNRFVVTSFNCVQCMKRTSCTGWIPYSIFHIHGYLLFKYSWRNKIYFILSSKSQHRQQTRPFYFAQFYNGVSLFYGIFEYFSFLFLCSFQCIHKGNSSVVLWTRADKTREKKRIVLRA